MPATRATITSVLKDRYEGPIIEQLNNEVMILDFMKKAVVSWHGQQVIVPVHIGRNTGVGFAAENAALPVAGQQGWERMQITARFLYGTFRISGPAIASAQAGGVGAFVAGLSSEMDYLGVDVGNQANRQSVSGGQIKGFITDKVDVPVTTGVPVAGGADNGGTRTYIFDGDFTAFLAVVNATTNTWVRVTPFNMNRGTAVTSYAAIAPSVATGALFVSDIPASLGGGTAEGTLELTVVDTAGAGTQFVFAGVVDAGNSIGLGLNATQYVSGGNFGTVVAFAAEWTGIFSNLALPIHHTITRTGGSGNEVLQSRCVTVDKTLTGVRAAMTIPLMQGEIDAIYLASGHGVDTLWWSPLQRQRYVALLIGVFHADPTKATNADGGFKQDAFFYGGRKYQASRHIPNGMTIFMKKNCWRRYELKKPGFADLDGSKIDRLNGFDSWEGFYCWYADNACNQPNAQSILSGFNL